MLSYPDTRTLRGCMSDAIDLLEQITNRKLHDLEGNLDTGLLTLAIHCSVVIKPHLLPHGNSLTKLWDTIRTTEGGPEFILESYSELRMRGFDSDKEYNLFIELIATGMSACTNNESSIDHAVGSKLSDRDKCLLMLTRNPWLVVVILLGFGTNLTTNRINVNE